MEVKCTAAQRPATAGWSSEVFSQSNKVRTCHSNESRMREWLEASGSPLKHDTGQMLALPDSVGTVGDQAASSWSLQKVGGFVHLQLFFTLIHPV